MSTSIKAWPSTTAEQAFTYSKEGYLIKSVAADGVVSLWSYYPAAGGNSPQLAPLLHANHRNDKWGASSDNTTLCLKAPKTPAGLKRPVLAQFQYQTFEGVILPVSLALYGHSQLEGATGQSAQVDTVVNLKGVIVSNLTQIQSNAETAWELKLATDRVYAEVHCQTTLEKLNETTASTTVTERRYWGLEKVQLVTTQKREPDKAAGVLKVTLYSRATDGGTDVELSSERRSLYNGQLLRRLEKGGQTRWEYDSMGRQVRQATYTNNTAQNDKDQRTDTALTDVRIRYQEINGGVRITAIDNAQSNARYQRVFQDGLQRTVRFEQQRVAGKDESDSNFVAMQSGDMALDYLPGGLQRQANLAAQPDAARDWFWVASKETEQAATADGSRPWMTEETVGDSEGARLIRQAAQQNLNNGGMRVTHTARLPSATLPQIKTEKVFDRLGRMTELKQSTRGAAMSERLFKVAYDELDRPITWTSPEGTQVKGAYGGMSNTVVRLSVTGSAAGATEILLGEQTLEANTRLKKRVVGDRSVGFTYTSSGTASTEMPNKTRYFSETSEDGNTLTWKVETTTGTTKVTREVAKFTYDPLNTALNAARSATDGSLADEPIASSKETLWLSSYARRVTSGLELSSGFYHSFMGAEHASLYAGNSKVIAWQDRLGRRTRVQRDHLEYHYRYNAQGECERVIVHDLQTGRTLNVDHEFDGFGQEVCRRYLLDHKEVEKYEQQWSGSGQMTVKTVTRNGTLCLTERFSYDTNERLEKWKVENSPDNSNGPRDASGKAILDQAYSYDVLNNLKKCATNYVGGSKQTQEYTYSTTNPTQRIKAVTINTPAPDAAGSTAAATSTEATLTYDTNGNMTKDEQGRALSYTVTGRLAAVKARNGQALTRYEYDEQDRLTVQWDEQTQQRQVLLYSGGALCGEVSLDQEGREIQRLRLDEEAGLAVQVITAQGQQTLFTFSDPQSGVTSEYKPGATGDMASKTVAYTPWGECDATQHALLTSGRGYNGARRDSLTGCYHPGEGYRVYNPSMRAFQQADTASPFGYGGLNDYAYCGGDPVNLHDPDGHVMISRWGQDEIIRTLDRFIANYTPAKAELPKQQDNTFGLISTILWAGVGVLISLAAVLLAIPTGGVSLVAAGVLLGATVASSALSIASSALQNSNPELAEKLGWAGFVIDMATMILPIKAAIKGGARLMRWAGSKAGRISQKITNIISTAKREMTAGFNGLIRSKPRIASGQNTGLIVSWGNIENDSYQVLHDTVHMSTDIYKGKPRIIFEMHGTEYEVPARAVVESNHLNAEQFLNYATSKGVDFKKYENIKLMMCCSANGDISSFASELSRRTKLPVKGYKGKVLVDYFAEKMNPDLKFGLAKALENRHGNYVDAIKVEQAFDGSWGPAELFKPVKFNGFASTKSKAMNPARLDTEVAKRMREIQIADDNHKRYKELHPALEVDLGALDLNDLL